MNKREARREAYLFAAGALWSDTSNCPFTPFNEDDADKIRKELRAISESLRKRGERMEDHGKKA